MTSQLATAARHVVVAFCSLSASVFPKQDQQQLRLGYLQSMLRVVLLWASPAAAAMHQASANDESELVDACRWVGWGATAPWCSAVMLQVMLQGGAAPGLSRESAACGCRQPERGGHLGPAGPEGSAVGL
jgi:hypothetical protein